MAGRRIVKSVVVHVDANTTHIHHDVARYFDNSDGSLTLMRGSNELAFARYPRVLSFEVVKR